MNRNFSGSQWGLTVCSKAWWQDRAYMLRRCWMLCGEASGDIGERDCRSLLSWQPKLQGSSVISSWENSDFLIKEAYFSACFLLILTPAAPFHYILVHFIPSVSWQPPPSLSFPRLCSVHRSWHPALPAKNRFTPFTEIVTPPSGHEDDYMACKAALLSLATTSSFLLLEKGAHFPECSLPPASKHYPYLYNSHE